MMTSEIVVLLIVGVLSFAGLAVAAMWFQQQAYDRAFTQLQALMLPGAEAIANQLDAQKEAAELVDALTSPGEDEDADLSPYEYLSPLAREYQTGYKYAEVPVEEEDDVVKEMRADIAAHWTAEFGEQAKGGPS